MKRADEPQVKERVERHRRHVTHSLLSEIGGNTGTKGSFGNVGSKRHRSQLNSFDDLFIFF